MNPSIIRQLANAIEEAAQQLEADPRLQEARTTYTPECAWAAAKANMLLARMRAAAWDIRKQANIEEAKATE